MQAVLDAADATGDPASARALVQQVFVSWRPTDFEGRVTLCAMAKVIGEDIRPFVPSEPVPEPWERRCFETLGRVWVFWAMNRGDVAEEMLKKLREEKGAHPLAGALHLMALDFWGDALEKLLQGDPPEARRFWKRAIEVGGTHGTPSHPAILWTYAATFI